MNKELEAILLTPSKTPEYLIKRIVEIPQVKEGEVLLQCVSCLQYTILTNANDIGYRNVILPHTRKICCNDTAGFYRA